jgi:hypothetical protein
MPNTEWIVEFREDDGVVEIVVNGFTMAVVTKRIFDKYVAEREKIKQKSADGEISELQAEFNAIKEQLCQDDSLV